MVTHLCGDHAWSSLTWPLRASALALCRYSILLGLTQEGSPTLWRKWERYTFLCNRCGDGIAGLKDQGTINLIVSQFITKYNELFREDDEAEPEETWVGTGDLLISVHIVLVLFIIILQWKLTGNNINLLLHLKGRLFLLPLPQLLRTFNCIEM